MIHLQFSKVFAGACRTSASWSGGWPLYPTHPTSRIAENDPEFGNVLGNRGGYSCQRVGSHDAPIHQNCAWTKVGPFPQRAPTAHRRVGAHVGMIPYGTMVS